MTGQVTPLRQRLSEDTHLFARQVKKHRVHYLFMLPYAAIFFTFTILPVLMSIVLSFTSFNMLEPPKGIWFDNYFRLFLNDDIFITALKNTVVLAVVTGPLGFLLSFFLAWLINELTHFARVFFTVVIYAPSISGGMFIMWTYLFSGDLKGYVNSLLFRLGLIREPILFFQDARFMVPLVILVVLWMSFGTSFLVFIAGFQGLDRQYYEAAAIDGIRNRWQELWYITLPLLRPQLLLNAVLSIVNAFTIGDVVTSLCGFPSTNYVAHTVINHLQDYGTVRYEMGYASAIATLLFAIMLSCNRLIRRLLKGIGT